MRVPTRLRLLALAAGVLLVAAACGGDDDTPTAATAATAAGSTAAGSPEPTSGGEQVELRLGYFPNLTHATAIVGVNGGAFAQALGPDVKLTTSTFNAGPEAVEALFGGALDATFIGPNPAINAYAKSGGEAIRIIAGATSGGASLVVKPEINSPADLQGKTLATPQLGNTQDVALRAWLEDNGLAADATGGGDVSIQPQENAATLDAFKSGSVDGAWVPEPWATRLVQEGGGKVLVDERSLWPDGRFVTTHLVVRTEYLDEHPDVVKRLLEGEVAATDQVNADPAAAQVAVNEGIKAVTGKALADNVLSAAWPNLEFTYDPIASSLRTSADHAQAVGLLDPVDLGGIYDLTLLNQVLAEQGRPAVDDR